MRQGLGATVDEILLCELQQEISRQSNVKVDIRGAGLGLINMQIQCLI